MKKSTCLKAVLASAGVAVSSLFAAGCGPAGPLPPPPPPPNVINVNLLYPTPEGAAMNFNYDEISIANSPKASTMTMPEAGILVGHATLVHPSTFDIPAKDNLGNDYQLKFSEWIHSRPDLIRLYRFNIIDFPVSFDDINLNLDVSAKLDSPIEIYKTAEDTVGSQRVIGTSGATITLAGLISSDVTYTGVVDFISQTDWAEDPAVADGLASTPRQVHHISYDMTVDLGDLKAQYENSSSETVRQIAAFIPPTLNVRSDMFLVPGVGMIRKNVQINATTLAIPPINLGNYDYSANDADGDHWLDSADLADDDINSH